MNGKITPSKTRIARWLPSVVRLLGSFGTFIVLLGHGTEQREFFLVGAVITLLAVVLQTIGSVLEERTRETVLRKKEEEIELNEAPPVPGEDVFNLLKRHIRLAVSRAEVSMIRADGRANNLFSLGRAFLVASILGPIAAAVLYWRRIR